MINHIGIHAMIEKYYQERKYPQELLKNSSQENTLILTAGIPEYQYGKIRAMGLLDYPYKIVWEGKDKVLELLRYIIFDL